MVEVNFFTNCKNQQDAKTVYRQLAKVFHPDKSGDSALMVQLQEQYEKFKPNTYEDFNNLSGMTFNPFYTKPHQNIPFDHPIHKVVKDLESQLNVRDRIIINNEKFIEDLKNQKRLLVDEVNKLMHFRDNMYEELNSKDKCIIELLNRIKNNPKTLWEHLKIWWENL